MVHDVGHVSIHRLSTQDMRLREIYLELSVLVGFSLVECVGCVGCVGSA